MKRITIIVIIIILSLKAYCQNEKPNMTNMYRFGYLINPGLSSFDFSNSFISLAHRAQWASVYQAPRYSVGSYSSRDILKPYSYDVYLLNNTIGPFDYSGLGLNYSYKFKLNEVASLSLGLLLGVYRSYVDLSKINDVGNIINLNNNEETYYFNTSFGSVLKYNNIKFGLSGSNIIGKKITKDGQYDSELEYKGYLSYLFGIKYNKKAIPSYGGSSTGGYLSSSKGGISFMPVAILSYSEQSKLNYGIFLMTEIEDMFRVQVGYEKQKGLNLLAGMSISKNLEIYYAYDFGGQGPVGVAMNSHEISLAYSILDEKIRAYPQLQNRGLTEAQVNEMINRHNKSNNKVNLNKQESITKLEKRIKELEQKLEENNRTKQVTENLTKDNRKIEEELIKIKDNYNSLSIINEDDDRKIDEINNRLNNLDKVLEQKTLPKSSSSSSDVNKIYVDNRINDLSRKINNKIDSAMNIINKIDRVQDVNILNNNITMSDSMTIKNKIEDLKNYVDKLKKEFNSLVLANQNDSKNIEEVNKRIDGLYILSQKTLPNSSLGNTSQNQIYIDDKVSSMSRKINNKMDSIINIINDISRIQKVNTSEGSSSNEITKNNSKEVDSKMKELKDYIDQRIAENNNQDNSVNEKLIVQEDKNLEKKIEILKIYIDNRIEELEKYDGKEAKPEDIASKIFYKELNERIEVLENKQKGGKNLNNKKEENTDQKYYLVIGVFFNEPIKLKEELVTKGFEKSNYIFNKKNDLYYLYLQYFENEKEARDYLKSINYIGGNIWISTDI